MTMREGFEAEFSAPPYEFDMSRFPESSAAWPGNYRDYNVQCAWEGFQAAYAAGQRAAEKERDEAQQVCAEAYQVVGSMLSDLGQFQTDRAKKVLDNLSQHRMVHGDVLPWPSFEYEMRARLEAMPSLYDRTGDIKDLNVRLVPLDAIRNRKDQA